MNYSELILQAIKVKSAIKEIDLIFYLMDSVNPTQFSRAEFDSSLKQLLEKREIVELIYMIKESVNRMYFPKDVKFRSWE